MPIFRLRKFTFFPFLILFKRIEPIDMTPCVIPFLVISGSYNFYLRNIYVIGKIQNVPPDTLNI